MYGFDEIEHLLGPQERKYAENKRRGGNSNVQGREFEEFYTVGRIARLAADCRDRESDGSDTFLEEQIIGFVDDLLVRQADDSTFSQIKDVQNLSWTGGSNPLEDDYRLQAALMNSLGRPAEFEIVVSTRQVHNTLVRSQPPALSYVRIVQHETGRLPEDLHKAPDMVESLWSLCAPFDDASALSNASEYLLAAWHSFRGKASLQDLLRKANRLSHQLICQLGPNFQLREEVRAILSDVEGFDYAVHGTTFAYWYGPGHGQGVAPFPCGSDRWLEFERKLLVAAPTDFIDVIDMLEVAE